MAAKKKKGRKQLLCDLLPKCRSPQKNEKASGSSHILAADWRGARSFKILLDMFLYSQVCPNHESYVHIDRFVIQNYENLSSGCGQSELAFETILFKANIRQLPVNTRSVDSSAVNDFD